MNAADFQRIGVRMYGSKHWRREYSINLGLDPSTVWRMSHKKTDLPLWLEVAVRALLDIHKQKTKAAQFAKEERARKQNRYRGKLTGKRRIIPKESKEQERENEPLEASADVADLPAASAVEST